MDGSNLRMLYALLVTVKSAPCWLQRQLTHGNVLTSFATILRRRRLSSWSHHILRIKKVRPKVLFLNIMILCTDIKMMFILAKVKHKLCRAHSFCTVWALRCIADCALSGLWPVGEVRRRLSFLAYARVGFPHFRVRRELCKVYASARADDQPFYMCHTNLFVHGCCLVLLQFPSLQGSWVV